MVWHDTQRPRIGDGWAIYNFLSERLPGKRTKSSDFYSVA